MAVILGGCERVGSVLFSCPTINRVYMCSLYFGGRLAPEISQDSYTVFLRYDTTVAGVFPSAVCQAGVIGH